MDISRAQEILDYWFLKDGSPDYDKWFMKSENYDDEIKEKFGELLKEAENGKGYGWLVSKDSFVAYIILMDQFSRHIYRGTGEAFKNDNGIMIFTEMGFELYREQLVGYEFMFAFMPYMHTENINYQNKGFHHFSFQMLLYDGGVMALRKPDPILKYMTKTQNQKDYEMLKQMKTHVEGHRSVISTLGRFPKRNKVLGRESTSNEIRYLDSSEVQSRPY